MELIKCIRCLEEKPASLFRKDPKKRNGLHSWCKKCRSKYESQRQKKLGINSYQKYTKHNPERKMLYQAQTRAANKKIRLEVIAYYSNNENKCSCCGESHIEFLAIDHIHGNGNKERKEKIIGSGSPFFRYLKKLGYPAGYRVLCHNCNMSHGCYGYCPHEEKSS